MTKKKILVNISGKLNFFKEDNYLRIKEAFKDYDLEFSLFPWEGQDNHIIKKFNDIYKPILYENIKVHNFDSLIKLIKFPDYAGNLIGTLHMYKSLCLSFNRINKIYKSKSIRPDYILRYRSDILPKNNQIFLTNKLENKSILIPDRYHWNGLNDQIFLMSFDDIQIFDYFDSFLIQHLKENRFFCSEYIFLRFIKKFCKINFTNFDYNIMRLKNFIKKKENTISKIPIKDLINCKVNKFKFKLRNFKNHYIKKINRNNFQDIYIEFDNNIT